MNEGSWMPMPVMRLWFSRKDFPPPPAPAPQQAPEPIQGQVQGVGAELGSHGVVGQLPGIVSVAKPPVVVLATDKSLCP